LWYNTRMVRQPVIAICWHILLAHAAFCGTITSVAEARRLDVDRCPSGPSFDFTGEVLSDGPHYWFFRDATGGTEIHNCAPGCHRIPPGATVRVRGKMAVDRNGIRKFLSERVELLRANRAEEPVEASAADILDGRMDYRFVRVRGVVSSVILDEIDDKFCWATLRTTAGKVYLTNSDKQADALQSAIDAEVVVTGLAAPVTGLRRNLGRSVATRTLKIVRRPPDDPFSAPALGAADTPHRQTARGVVLAAEPHRFFLKTTGGRVVPVHPVETVPAHGPVAGDLVAVSGFATDVFYSTLLSDALVRIEGHTAVDAGAPPLRTLRSLFVNDKGLDRIDTIPDGTFITVRGRARTVSADELRIAEGTHFVSIDIPTLRALGADVPPDGSRVAASGLCLVEFGAPPTPTIYPVFRRFVLVPRNAGDVTVLASPSWWTPFRLTLLVIALATVLFGSALWNVTLRRKSEKHGRELYEEKIGHALAEQKVEERTRLAVELHDSVSQTLTGIALQLDGGETEAAKTLLASCRGELRRCLWDLRSRTFEEKDMTEAVTRTITPHLNGCRATVRFNVPRERLSESLTHTILRIIRELVVNAVHHGLARHVKIAGEMHDDVISFSVRDDGRGFDPQAAPGPELGHFGLLGIRERLEGLDGELQVESAPGRGARFTVTMRTNDTDNEQ